MTRIQVLPEAPLCRVESTCGLLECVKTLIFHRILSCRNSFALAVLDLDGKCADYGPAADPASPGSARGRKMVQHGPVCKAVARTIPNMNDYI